MTPQAVGCQFPFISASDSSWKKVKSHAIFGDRFTEKLANFAKIFGVNFTEKQLVKNGNFVGIF